jgi:hypothetical protein
MSPGPHRGLRRFSRTLTLPTLNYRELAAPIRRGRNRRNRLCSPERRRSGRRWPKCGPQRLGPSLASPYVPHALDRDCSARRTGRPAATCSIAASSACLIHRAKIIIGESASWRAIDSGPRPSKRSEDRGVGKYKGTGPKTLQLTGCSYLH